MVPIVAEVRARSLDEFGPLLRHGGEEYFLVTSGRVAVHTEFYAPEILGEGDGIYLDSTMGHAYLNAGEGTFRQGGLSLHQRGARSLRPAPPDRIARRGAAWR